jgi:hypothetical protein
LFRSQDLGSKVDYFRDGKEVQAKARTQSSPISLLLLYGSIITFFSSSLQREEKASILRSHRTCPLYGGNHRSIQTLIGEGKDFRLPFLKIIGSGPLQPNTGVAYRQVLE